MSQEDERQLARRERLEAELRANLKRRKEQARARRECGSAMDEADQEPGEEPGQDPAGSSGDGADTESGKVSKGRPNGLQTQ